MDVMGYYDGITHFQCFWTEGTGGVFVEGKELHALARGGVDRVTQRRSGHGFVKENRGKNQSSLHLGQKIPAGQNNGHWASVSAL